MPADSITVTGVRGEVLLYIADQLNYLDEVAQRTGTSRPSSERLPLERLEHLEALVKVTRTSATHNQGVPSPHYLRALAAQSCAWLEELRERGEVSW